VLAVPRYPEAMTIRQNLKAGKQTKVYNVWKIDMHAPYNKRFHEQF
jgi:hypothetical protein